MKHVPTRFQSDCICLEDNRHSTDSSGRIVSGSYSYLDPVGSLITVTYTNGADGYQEKRRVQKNYGQATSAEVVTEVLERLQGEVLTVIETTLTRSDLRTTRTSVLVGRVVDRLRPAVTNAARSALKNHRNGVVEESEVSTIVEQILVELRPFIANRVDQHKDTQVRT